MNYVDACAGIGGWRLALDMAGVQIDYHGFSEVDTNAIRIYQAHWPNAANLGDLTRWREWGIAPGWLDIFSAGFPCPPFSVAGKRLGGDDPRNLWPVVADAIRGLRPRYALLENVPGILFGNAGQPSYFGRVLGDLAEAGYDAEWRVLSAAQVGASHRRERVWIVAHRNGDGAGERCDSDAKRGDVGTLPQWRDNEGAADASAHVDSSSTEHLAVPRCDGRRTDNEGECEARRGRLDKTSGDVGDALSERNTARARQDGSEKHFDVASEGLGRFPPAPNDAEGWRRVLAVRLDLAPAIDGRLGVAFTTWLMGYPVEWCSMVKRNAALKALGNAIVPQCAALAIRMMGRIGETR